MFPSLRLNDGSEIPQLAYGTGSVNNGKDVHEFVEAAVETGFRHLDTAQLYHNEQAVGQAIGNLKFPRSQLYVTTKLGRSPDGVGALEESLRKLGLGYVDLYLIHHPRLVPDVPAAWQALQKAQEEGLARSVGVSNFTVNDFLKIEGSKVVPAVNQIRLHPYNLVEQAPALAYAAKHKIIIEAYGSLAPITTLPGGPLDAVIDRIAKIRKATPAQVLFLWVVAKGAVIVTTSSKEDRMKEYLATVQFPPLSLEEVAEIDTAGSAPWPSARIASAVTLPALNAIARRTLILVALTVFFFATRWALRLE